MLYHLLFGCIGLALDFFAAIRIAPDEKDLQIILLRQQLRILERKSSTKPRISSPEKLIVVALFARVKRQTQSWYDRLQEILLLFKPDTLLRWHRDLVRDKWTFRHPNPGGRPRLETGLEVLIL